MENEGSFRMLFDYIFNRWVKVGDSRVNNIFFVKMV